MYLKFNNKISIIYSHKKFKDRKNNCKRKKINKMHKLR